MAARQERRNNFKTRIFSCCSYECYLSIFNIREQKILLSFVKSMDFIEKKNFWFFAFRFKNLSYICFPSRDSRKLKKLCIKTLSINSSNGCFSDSWRSPENKRKQVSFFYRFKNRFSRRYEMLLPDNIREWLRTDVWCKRFWHRSFFDKKLYVRV